MRARANTVPADSLTIDRGDQDFSRRMIDSLPGVVYLYDEQRRFIRWNREFERVSGYSSEEIEAMHPLDFFSAEDKPRVDERITETFARGASSIEASLVTKDGTAIPHLFTGRRILYENIACLVGMGIDITERKAAEANAEESERRFRTMADSIPQLAWIADPDGVIVWYNQRWRDYTGITADAHRSSGWDTMTDSQSASRALAEWKTCIATREEFEMEFPLRSANGHFRRFLTRATPLKDSAGDVIHWFGTNTDVDELKLLEDTLRKSESMLSAAQAIARIGSWETDLSTFAVAWSDETHRIFGTDPARFHPTHEAFLQFIYPDDRAAVDKAFVESVERRAPSVVEHRIVTPDGGVKSIEERWEVICDDQGNAVRAIGTCQDITERKFVAERVTHQAQMLDLAHDAISVRDLTGRIEFWNRGAASIFGWSSADAVGRNACELLQTDSESYATASRLTLESGFWSGEFKYTASNGNSVVVDSRWTLVRNDGGEPKSILVISSDITAQKQMEAQFLRAQRIDSIGTLAGGIAHDLNNVLGPIILSLDLLRTKFPDPDSIELIDIISSSAHHGANMVNQVLSFARGVTGERIEVQVGDLIREIEKIVAETFPKDIELRTIVPLGLCTVVGDPTQMYQVLLNLCVNARDAMQGGGTLSVSAKDVVLDALDASMNLDAKPGRYVCLQVDDNGTGIPAEIIDNIFDPFFTTKEVGKGTGLGLSTSMAIVKSHGGYISVLSEVGRGTMVKVYLPSLPAGPVHVASVDAAARPRGDGELVLVVDDEPAVRSITRRTLESFGYRVITAKEGSEALAIFSERGGDIDVVLTDMSMPVLDGFQTIQRLRAIDPDVRIVASSGNAVEDQDARLARLAVAHFLPKPYTVETLLTTLKEILES